MSNDDMADKPGKRAPKGRTCKAATILKLLFFGRSLNRFEAERHHDHCLHSTIAALEALGVKVCRKWESVPCLDGQAWTRVKRYWLDREPENLTLVRGMLIAWRVL